FKTGTRVRLYPHHAPGSVFARWAGGCIGRGVCLIELRAPQTVVAVFRAAPPPLKPPLPAPPPPPPPPPGPPALPGHFVGVTSQNEQVSFDVSSLTSAGSRS